MSSKARHTTIALCKHFRCLSICLLLCKNKITMQLGRRAHESEVTSSPANTLHNYTRVCVSLRQQTSNSPSLLLKHQKSFSRVFHSNIFICTSIYHKPCVHVKGRAFPCVWEWWYKYSSLTVKCCVLWDSVFCDHPSERSSGLFLCDEKPSFVTLQLAALPVNSVWKCSSISQ